MKIKVLSRNPDDYIRETKRDIHKVPRNYDPSQHPFQAPREYVRALNATKLERVFAKPFIGSLDGHGDGVTRLAKHPKRLSLLLSGACDGEVKLWNLASRECVSTVQAHNGLVKGITCHPNGRYFFTCGIDKIIKQWDITDEGEIIAEPTNTILGKTLYSDMDHHWSEDMFATAGERVDVWDESRTEPVRSFTWGVESIHSISFNPIEVQTMAAVASDRSIMLYDMRGANPLRKVILKLKSNAVRWNPMEAYMFTVANEDYNLYSFDMRYLNRPLNIYKDHVAAVMDLDFAPTGKEMVTAGYDKTIRIFPVEKTYSRDIYHTKRMQKVLAVKWSLDNKYLLSASEEMNIRVWKSRASHKSGTLNDYVSEMMGMFNKTQDSIKDIQDKLGPDPVMQLFKENAAELENIKARLDETDNDMVTWEGLHACLKGDRDRFIRNQSGESSLSSLPREDIIETLEDLGHIPHIISTLVERVDALEDIVKMKGNGIEGTLMERLDSLVDETNRSRIDINNILSGLGEEPSALMQNLAYLKDNLNVHKDDVEEMKKQLATHIANYLRDLDQLRQSMSQAEHVPHPVIQAPSPIHVFASRPPSPPRQLPEVKPSIDPKKFEDLHNEVINLAQIASELMKEGKEQLLKLEEASSVIEKLQLDKADKDPVWKEIDKKVDKCELDLKVDDATFVDNMGKINDTITELLEKLGMQELDWRDTIDKLNSEINLKLNRKELSSLKTWLETKLKNLNSKIQKTNTLDDEAAGIKKQLIQKFNCISCDRPIEMTPSGPVASIPFQGGLPPTKSPRPYTTFELDQIRQHAKNMLQTTTEMGDSYMMDRPCGGSHTVTYPNKRISKTAISNLFRDDGSSIMKPLYKDELEIMGIDGRIYHGRNGRDKLPHVMPSYRPKSAPGEKTPEKKSSPSHHSPHPPSPSALTHSYAVQTSMLDSQLPVEVILPVSQNLS